MKEKLHTLAKCILQICAFLLIFAPNTLINEISVKQDYYYTHTIYDPEYNIPFSLFQATNERVSCTIIVGILMLMAIFCITVYSLQLKEKIASCDSLVNMAKIASIIQLVATIVLFFVVKIPVKTPSIYRYEFAPQESFFYLPIVLLGIIIIDILEQRKGKNVGSKDIPKNSTSDDELPEL